MRRHNTIRIHLLIIGILFGISGWLGVALLLAMLAAAR